MVQGVRVELTTFDDKEIKMLIITVHNEGGTNESSNYTYVVSVNRDVISTGEVLDFNRDMGWEALIDQVLRDVRHRKSMASIKSDV